MRLFGQKHSENTRLTDGTPVSRAYDEVWNREMARLGQNEVVRRIAALNDYKSGRTGPSGYESWNQKLEREIMRLAYEITLREDR